LAPLSVTEAHCRGRIAYGHEALELSDKIADFCLWQLISLERSGVEMIDNAGLGEN
jgi:hypothetical protein